VTLVDTNVLLDILSADPAWSAWSLGQLLRRSTEGALLINEVIYAEMSTRIETETQLDAIIADLRVELERTPKRALFLAGKAFKRYRASGGIRTGVLPDFFIGAHAEVAGFTILTRDACRYALYFPKVKVVSPEK
jgi:predicted nucleic acid-binding protein